MHQQIDDRCDSSRAAGRWLLGRHWLRQEVQPKARLTAEYSAPSSACQARQTYRAACEKHAETDALLAESVGLDSLRATVLARECAWSCSLGKARRGGGGGGVCRGGHLMLGSASLILMRSVWQNVKYLTAAQADTVNRRASLLPTYCVLLALSVL
jgi:hypothetical protein